MLEFVSKVEEQKCSFKSALEIAHMGVVNYYSALPYSSWAQYYDRALQRQSCENLQRQRCENVQRHE
jgi:hypothetical protein